MEGHSAKDAETLAYIMDFAEIATNSEVPKLAAMKRVGPDSKKFKEWRHGTEIALASLLGEESIVFQKFTDLQWPEETGWEFSGVVDEAGIILDNAMKNVWRVYPGLKKMDVVLHGDQFPPELRGIITEVRLCLGCGAFSAASVMARKAVEAAIFLRFEREEMLDEILTAKGDTLSFEEKVGKAQSHAFLSPQRAKELKHLKLYGDGGAHSWKIAIGEDDVKLTLTVLKLCLQELFPQNAE